MNVAETLGNKELSNSRSSRPGKYVALTHPLYDYIARHRSRVVDPLLYALRAGTESLGDGLAIDRLNRKLASDPRVELVLLPIADGLHLERKRQAGER